jgi:hypothetical protein
MAAVACKQDSFEDIALSIIVSAAVSPIQSSTGCRVRKRRPKPQKATPDLPTVVNYADQTAQYAKPFANPGPLFRGNYHQ